MSVQAKREKIGPQLSRISRRWRAKLDERLGRLGLTQAKGITLLYLSRAGGSLPQGDLAERVGVEGPTLVRILDGLERKGLIERRVNPDDRRTNSVHITPEAEQTVGEILSIAAEVRDTVLSGVSDEELAVLEGVLLKVSRNIGIPCSQG